MEKIIDTENWIIYAEEQNPCFYILECKGIEIEEDTFTDLHKMLRYLVDYAWLSEFLEICAQLKTYLKKD